MQNIEFQHLLELTPVEVAKTFEKDSSKEVCVVMGNKHFVVTNFTVHSQVPSIYWPCGYRACMRVVLEIQEILGNTTSMEKARHTMTITIE